MHEHGKKNVTMVGKGDDWVIIQSGQEEDTAKTKGLVSFRERNEGSDRGPQKDLRDVSPHIKAYTIQDQKILFEQAKRSDEEGDKYGYDGTAKVKKPNLVEDGEGPKPVYIFNDLTS